MCSIVPLISKNSGAACGRDKLCKHASGMHLTSRSPRKIGDMSVLHRRLPRIVSTALLLVTVVLLGAAVPAMPGQTFARDSQTYGTVTRAAPDSLWQQQMTELMGFMRSQQILEERRAADRADVLRRLADLERVHPYEFPWQIKNLEEKAAQQQEDYKQSNRVQMGILAAVFVALISSWINNRKR